VAHFQNQAAWQEAIKLIDLARESNSSDLSLSGLRLKTLPENFNLLAEELKTLTLENCRQLTTLNGLEHCTQLQSLDLSGCVRITLDGLAEALKDTSKLQSLDLSFCYGLSSLDGLAEALKDTPKLHSLNLSSCRGSTSLDGLAEALKDKPQLQSLNLSDCNGLTSLDGLAEALKDKPQLQSLDLSDCNRLTSLDGLAEALKDTPKLQWLDLSGCNALTMLDGLAGALRDNTQLQSLDLSDCNELTSLDGLAEALKDKLQLQSLDLSDCNELTNLDGLAEALKDTPQLQSLDLSDCNGLTSLNGLAEALKDTPQLQSLNLSYCDGLTSFDGLAEALKDKPQLQSIDLSDCNGLTTLDGLAVALKNKPQLQSLGLSDCNGLNMLDGLAETLKDKPQLQSLDLSYCDGLTSFDDLAEALKDKPQLQSLDLSYCNGLTSFDGLAEALKDKPQLQSLNFAGCWSLTSFDGLAEALKDKPQLQSLNFARCGSLTSFDGLAEALKDKPQLESLNFRHCGSLTSFDGLAEALKDNTQLQLLDLTNCSGLTTLDGLVEVLRGHTQFKHLKLEGCSALKLTFNQLDSLMVQFPYLDFFIRSDLYIQNVPKELTKGIFFLDFLEDWYCGIQQGKICLNLLKLHFIGNGRIGKTQLARQLEGLPFDDKVPSTHGIQINKWLLDKNAKDSPTVYSWDFGGQDIYLGTHSLFLDDSAVYCLLWHPDFENTQTYLENNVSIQNKPLSYWLAYIHSLAGDKAPIIVAQSQCDSPLDDKNAPIPSAQPFDFIKPTTTSAKVANGLEEFMPVLKRAINYQLARNGEIFLPLSWYKVVEQLERDKKAKVKKLNYSHFLDYCQTHDVGAPETLLYYLHDCGQIFYNKGIFNNQVILDQAWSLQGVYSLLERGSTLPILQEQHGRFSTNIIAELLWNPEGYTQEEQRLFLDMMLQCKVCFKISDNNYIAPDSLPTEDMVKEKISTIWRDATANVHVQLHYSFLHDACLREMLSSIGDKVGEDALYWRYGCCYFDGTHKTTLKLMSKLCKELNEDEISNFGQPGIIDIELNGVQANKLAKHLIDSILKSHHLGKAPTVTWLKGGDKLKHEEKQMQQNNEPFSQLSPAVNLPKVYFSYAWGGVDDQHQQVCDALNTALKHQTTIQVMRDKESLASGDSIVEFEKEIGQANHIIIIFSAKSLQSEDCMRELEFIYRCCLHDKGHFTQRVIPIILNDVNIGTTRSRVQYAKYWKTEYEQLLDDSQGIEDSEVLESKKLLGNIKDCLVKVLSWSNDIILNRDQQYLAKENYSTIIELLLKRVNEKYSKQSA